MVQVDGICSQDMIGFQAFTPSNEEKDSFGTTRKNLALGHGILLKSGNLEQAMTKHLVAQERHI